MNTKRKVLIADDVAINRLLLQEVIGERYDTVLAADGEETIKKIMEYENDLALVLLDIRMPKRSGFDVLKYMQQNQMTERIPVIVITSSDDYQDELRAYDFGASDIIHKPFVSQVVQRRAENTMELFAQRRSVLRELELSKLALEDLQSFDVLTGQYTMKSFLEKANETLRAAETDGSVTDCYFVYNNICNFVDRNLKDGAEAGDQLLKDFSAKLSEVCEEGDMVARFNSHHFVALLKQPSVMEAIEQYRSYFVKKFEKKGLKLKIGVYQVQQHIEEGATACCELAKAACDSIYDSDEEICVYSEKLSGQLDISTYVVQHLDAAIEKENIQVYYQPIIRTLPGTLCGMEALSRWIDPTMGVLLPADVIPVLERNHLLFKLDLYMLRAMCREMKQAEEKELSLIPVSFNLSRTDFMDCDIYAEIEKIVREYDIPRDMINIEITEATIMDNPHFLKSIIRRFRDVGYQIWLDDFGSGYCSLNILKDFSFDAIKLDMKFLNSYDENSQKVIESIILMAKSMGIQTIAEGVESKEQLEYLRSIGCEKAQGYLLGKPMPIAELYEKTVGERGKVEKRAWRNYYNEIGKVNLRGDCALAIVEFHQNHFEYMYVSSAYEKEWALIGITDMNVIYENTNSMSSPLGRQLLELQRVLHKGSKPQDVISIVHGQNIRLQIECVAENEDVFAYIVELTRISNRNNDNKRNRMDKICRMMCSLYDSIYLLNLSEGRFQTILHGAAYHVDAYRKFHDEGRIKAELAGEMFIHPADKKAFESFTDSGTLLERLKSAERQQLTQYFRTRTRNGAYVWKEHTMLYISSEDCVIYCSRKVSADESNLMLQYPLKEQPNRSDTMQQLASKSYMESKVINVFWKDEQRRFLGANESFLKTWGFTDASEIIGKTDEEMGWHINTEPFEKDEWRVLKQGEIIANRIGQCIIQGVPHHILVCKEPMYEDGKIVGLIGSFIDIDAIYKEYERGIEVHDSATGLLAASGIAKFVAEYAEGFVGRKENFAVICITIPEYFRIAQTYGERFAKALLSKAGEFITESVKVSATCARLYAGSFVVIMKCDNKQQIAAIVEDISAKFENLHELDGSMITIRPQMNLYYADETDDIRTILGVASGMSLLEESYQGKLIANERSQHFSFQIAKALAMDFLNVYIVNPEKNEAINIKMDGFVPKGLSDVFGGKIPYDAAVEQYLKYRVYKEDRERVAREMSVEGIAANLANCDAYSFSFQVVNERGGTLYFQQKQIRTDQEGVYIIAFQNIDSLMTEEIHKKQLYENALANNRKAYEKLRQRTLEASMYYQALKKNTRFIYACDLTDGYLRDVSEIPGGKELLKTYGLSLPITYDAFRKAYYDGMELEPLKNSDTTNLREDLLRRFAVGETSFSTEYYSVKYKQYHRDSIFLYQQGKDGHVFALVIGVDTTKQRTAEEQAKNALQEAYEEAQSASRAKTDFLSRMSHDIRTPINGIVGMAYIMEHEIDNPQIVQESLNNIKTLSEQLELLINDVLEMSRIESGKVSLTHEHFNLREKLEQNASAIRVLAESNEITLAGAHYHITHSMVVGSPLQIQRIAMNILSNAVKYNRPGGWVECWLEERTIDNRQSSYRMTIQDTGIGMSEEFLKNVFEPFSREQKKEESHYSGTGLGMAITKELVERMGGTIRIESKEDVGTKVVVDIPLEIGEEKADRKTEAVSSNSLEGKRILIVDDNPLNAEVLRFMLEEEGATIEAADNGQQAVDLFCQNQGTYYDMILMDVKMPVLDGFEATKRIRMLDQEEAKRIPILAISANAFEEDVIMCRKAGMNDHIAKPIKVEKVMQKIKKYL